MAENIIWQSMNLDYFYQLIMRNELRLTLQHLRNYGVEERKQYLNVIGELCYIAKYIRYYYDEEVHFLHKKLNDCFSAIDLCTYISCFYNRSEPSANLLRQFGGGNGVSVGFNKSKVVQIVNEQNQHKYKVWRSKKVKYIRREEDSLYLRDKIKKFVRVTTRSGKRNMEIKPFEFQKTLIYSMFQKSANYESEQEFRIICGINPEVQCKDSLEYLDLPPDAIEKIAVFSDKKPMNFFVNSLSEYSKYSFGESEFSQNHPLSIYTVKLKEQKKFEVNIDNETKTKTKGGTK